MNFAQRRGFSLSIAAHEYEAAPPDAKRLFVQALKKGRTYTCTTSELCGLNARLLDAAKDSLLLSLQVVDGVLSTVRERLPALVAFSEASSMLDMLVNAFGITVSGCERPYVRPQFTPDGPLAIQAGRHPVACARMHDGGKLFVANSAFLSEAASHVVVSGANMSGKARRAACGSASLASLACSGLTLVHAVLWPRADDVSENGAMPRARARACCIVDRFLPTDTVHDVRLQSTPCSPSPAAMWPPSLHRFGPSTASSRAWATATRRTPTHPRSSWSAASCRCC